MNTPSKFFQELYRSVTHGYAEIRLLHHTGDISLAKKIYRPAMSIHECNFDYLTEMNEQGYHIYHRVNISEKPQSKKADISQVVALWLEIDNNDSSIEERLIEYHFPPTAVIHSGSGYHAYWLLKEPQIIDSQRALLELERTLEGMILDWGADSGADKHTKDITRILRTPHFYNIKAKYAPDYPQARIVWYDDSQGDRYKFAHLHKRYAPLGAPITPPIRRALPVLNRNDKPKWIQNYLETGEGEGNRNQRLFVVARWFCDVGNKSAEVEQDLISRALADGLSQAEAVATIRSAWAQAPNPANSLPSHMRRIISLEDNE